MTRPRSMALSLLLLVCAGSALAGPRLVRVPLSPSVTVERLLEAGLDLCDHAHADHVDVLEWPGDAATLARLGAQVHVLDADPGRSLADRARADLRRHPPAEGKRVWSAAREDGRFRVEVAPPQGGGALGGFWNLAEVKIKLDDLVASDAHGVVADKVDTVGWSLQGRPIWGLQLSTPAAGTDTRPVAFYNSLTHSREPGGMQALFYFVDDLLARYPADAVARTLLEQRRIYIVPVVNPDGYAYNQQIWESSGSFGMWRKNLADNNSNGSVDGGDGVDLNRNFPFRWGFNNSGSSGSPSAATYRGPNAGSEPESQAQMAIVSQLRPVTGFSFHTYSDLLIHPWGWTTAGTPDSAKFQEWNDELSLENGYTAGPGPRILYEVNGEFNDWSYGDTLSKPKAYTWTPEVGGQSDGFWPTPSRIVPLGKEMLRSCYVIAQIAGPWARVERSQWLEGALNAGHSAHLSLRARNIGATGAMGPGLRATLTAIDPEIEVLTGPVDYPTLAPFQSADASGAGAFLVAAADTVTPGRMLRLKVEFSDDAGRYSRDTVEVLVGTPTVLLNDGATNLANWSVGTTTWNIVSNDPNHPSRYFSDSPFGRYQSSINYPFPLRPVFNLSPGTHAWLLMENRWLFESEFDLSQVEASLDSVNWTALRSRGTTPSTSFAVGGANRWVFKGSRWKWRPDRVDLSAFAGGPAANRVRLRFRSNSDSGFELDGFSMDSVRVLLFDPAAQPAPVAVGRGERPAALQFLAPSPNPARGATRFDFALPQAADVRLELFDAQGRRVRTLISGRFGADRWARGWDLRDDAGRPVPAGVYLARLRAGEAEFARRVVVLD